VGRGHVGRGHVRRGHVSRGHVGRASRGGGGGQEAQEAPLLRRTSGGGQCASVSAEASRPTTSGPCASAIGRFATTRQVAASASYECYNFTGRRGTVQCACGSAQAMVWGGVLGHDLKQRWTGRSTPSAEWKKRDVGTLTGGEGASVKGPACDLATGRADRPHSVEAYLDINRGLELWKVDSLEIRIVAKLHSEDNGARAETRHVDWSEDNGARAETRQKDSEEAVDSGQSP
jgi:hypothetical protein